MPKQLSYNINCLCKNDVSVVIIYQVQNRMDIGYEQVSFNLRKQTSDADDVTSKLSFFVEDCNLLDSGHHQMLRSCYLSYCGSGC